VTPIVGADGGGGAGLSAAPVVVPRPGVAPLAAPRAPLAGAGLGSGSADPVAGAVGAAVVSVAVDGGSDGGFALVSAAGGLFDATGAAGGGVLRPNIA
jgi:hypothetical protein